MCDTVIRWYECGFHTGNSWHSIKTAFQISFVKQGQHTHSSSLTSHHRADSRLAPCIMSPGLSQVIGQYQEEHRRLNMRVKGNIGHRIVRDTCTTVISNNLLQSRFYNTGWYRAIYYKMSILSCKKLNNVFMAATNCLCTLSSAILVFIPLVASPPRKWILKTLSRGRINSSPLQFMHHSPSTCCKIWTLIL